jgi:peptidoglycan/LPS O-acetylase OafA/YrhL
MIPAGSGHFNRIPPFGFTPGAQICPIAAAGMTDQPPMPSQLRSLDLIRGAMALLVFLSHVSIATGSMNAFPLLFRFGGIAVEVFMFVSGFLMTWHYLDREHKEPWSAPSTWRQFYVRRFFRIAPLYYLLVTAAFALQTTLMPMNEHLHDTFPPAWAGVSTAHDPTIHDLTPLNLALHYSFLFGFVPAYASNTLLPDWSIGLEMQFYLAFPFLALLFRRAGPWVSTVLLCGAGFLARRWMAEGITSEPGPLGLFPMATFLPLRIAVFTSGMLAAFGIAALSRGHRADKASAWGQAELGCCSR